MKINRTAILLIAFSLLLPFAASAQKNQSSMNPPVKYEEFTLPNGLRVIMHEDRSTPIVAVNLWYHVGSKNEVKGKTGFAHLFEHMMFQGSKHHDNDYFAPLQEAGASINGSTNADRTNYYQVVPSNFLELALWLESDRMGYLLDAMTMEKLNNQRDVVKNERRQRYDNQPYGTAFEKISALLYPANHPYSWTTIGSLDDLSAASMEDVKAFFRQYYVPNNATLTLAGDFNPREARRLIEKYFAPIPKGAKISRPNAPQPKFDKEVRANFEDNVQLPRVYMVWHTVPQYAPDEAALDMLGTILSSGRGSRLQSSLVYGKQISQDIGASHNTREIAGQFQVTSTARPGKSLEDIEREILAEIERIKKEPPTAEEMERALNGRESAFIYGLQTVLGKADQLNSYATFVGKPDYFGTDLERYRKVTPADIQRVANTYLNSNRLVVTFVPRGKDKVQSVAQTAANRPTSVAEKKEKKPEQDTSKLGGLYVPPKPKPDPKFTLPRVEKNKLSNGLEVWLVRQNELPIVSMNLVFKSGATADPSGKAGLSSITASLLDDGTKTRSAVDISNAVQQIGARLGTGSGWDSSSVSIQTLTKNLDKALDIFSDVVVNPAFPNQELETFKRRMLVGLLQQRDNPNAIANVAYSMVLYGKDHPYGASPNESSVRSIDQKDIQRFYETFYRPNNATLIVVGDVTSDELLPKLEKAFANWKAAEIPAVTAPVAPARDKAMIYIVDKPGAAQSIISIGQVGVPRTTEDFFALQVMNTMLGGQFSSRVNMNLREDKGYTYGARTGFEWRRGAGPFSASAGVQTAVTKESVNEFMKELRGIRGEIPVTSKELEYNKQSLIRRFPAGFETVDQIAGQLATAVIYNLPENYFNDYISKINSITIEDVNRVANKYLDPSKMAIVIVGDRKVIEPGLRELQDVGTTITFLDTEGNPATIATNNQ
ncbi:MAG: insulinase family protein [Acidobacteriota bacterium]|nr:insulinase family protein [Acidobacteriota bacterium]